MDCEDYKLRTPLFYATKVGSFSNILLLVKEYGAHVNHSEKSGKTPLFKARTYETTKLLLKCGVSSMSIHCLLYQRIALLCHFGALSGQHYQTFRIEILRSQTNFS